MTQNSRHTSAAGFSLIEIMVVVAILGILASMGVASLTNMAERARQNQAKSHLSQLYSALRSFHSEWAQYYGDWRNLAVEINGELYYRVGFGSGAGATSLTAPANYIGPGLVAGSNAAQVNSDPVNGYCATGPGLGSPCFEIASQVCDLQAACAWTANTFRICGCGFMRNNAGAIIEDTWTLDQDKVFTRTEN